MYNFATYDLLAVQPGVARAYSLRSSSSSAPLQAPPSFELRSPWTSACLRASLAINLLQLKLLTVCLPLHSAKKADPVIFQRLGWLRQLGKDQVVRFATFWPCKTDRQHPCNPALTNCFSRNRACNHSYLLSVATCAKLCRC